MRFSDLLDAFFYRPDEDVTGIFDPGSIPEPRPRPAEQEALAEFLGFRLASELYALPLRDLREIVKVPPLTEVPRAAPTLLGVMNLRGEVLPVYDLKPVLGLPAVELNALPRSARVLVLRAPGGDAGVLVDGVLEVVRMRPSSLEVSPAEAGAVRSPITGIGRRGEALFAVLDLEQALP